MTPNIDAVVETLTLQADAAERVAKQQAALGGFDPPMTEQQVIQSTAVAVELTDLRAILSDHARLAKGRAVLEAALAYGEAWRDRTPSDRDAAAVAVGLRRAALAYAKAIKEEG
jgi:hypothetical protein